MCHPGTILNLSSKAVFDRNKPCLSICMFSHRALICVFILALDCKPVFKITDLQRNYKGIYSMKKFLLAHKFRVSGSGAGVECRGSPCERGLLLIPRWELMKWSDLGRFQELGGEVRKLSSMKRKQAPRKRELWGCRMLNSFPCCRLLSLLSLKGVFIVLLKYIFIFPSDYLLTSS